MGAAGPHARRLLWPLRIQGRAGGRGRGARAYEQAAQRWQQAHRDGKADDAARRADAGGQAYLTPQEPEGTSAWAARHGGAGRRRRARAGDRRRSAAAYGEGPGRAWCKILAERRAARRTPAAMPARGAGRLRHDGGRADAGPRHGGHSRSGGRAAGRRARAPVARDAWTRSRSRYAQPRTSAPVHPGARTHEEGLTHVRRIPSLAGSAGAASTTRGSSWPSPSSRCSPRPPRWACRARSCSRSARSSAGPRSRSRRCDRACASLLFGLFGPFAAVLMERYGLRRIVCFALAADRHAACCWPRASAALWQLLRAVGRGAGRRLGA